MRIQINLREQIDLDKTIRAPESEAKRIEREIREVLPIPISGVKLDFSHYGFEPDVSVHLTIYSEEPLRTKQPLALIEKTLNEKFFLPGGKKDTRWELEDVRHIPEEGTRIIYRLRIWKPELIEWIAKRPTTLELYPIEWWWSNYYLNYEVNSIATERIPNLHPSSVLPIARRWLDQYATPIIERALSVYVRPGHFFRKVERWYEGPNSCEWPWNRGEIGVNFSDVFISRKMGKAEREKVLVGVRIGWRQEDIEASNSNWGWPREVCEALRKLVIDWLKEKREEFLRRK